MLRYVKLRLAGSIGRKIVSLFTQFFRVFAVLAKGSARAVRNVFCFKATEYFASSEKPNKTQALTA